MISLNGTSAPVWLIRLAYGHGGTRTGNTIQLVTRVPVPKGGNAGPTERKEAVKISGIRILPYSRSLRGLKREKRMI